MSTQDLRKMEQIFLMRNVNKNKYKKVMISKSCPANKKDNRCLKSFVSFVKIQNALIIVKVSVKELSITNVEKGLKKKE